MWDVMEKILEDYLWNETGFVGENKPIARDVIDEMIKNGWIKNRKQAIRTLEKWMSKNKWNYGCNIEVGWKEKIEDRLLSKVVED